MKEIIQIEIDTETKDENESYDIAEELQVILDNLLPDYQNKFKYISCETLLSWHIEEGKE